MLRLALTQVWESILQPEVRSARFELQLERVREAHPPEDGWVILTPYAHLATLAVLHTLKCRIPGDARSAARAAQQAMDAMDELATELLGIHADPHRHRTEIEGHPLVGLDRGCQQ